MDPVSTLESLADKIAAAKQARAFGTSIQAALSAAANAKPTLDTLERLSGFAGLVADSLNNDERHNFRSALKNLRQLGEGVLKAEDQESIQESARLMVHDLPKDVAAVQILLNGVWKKLIDKELGAVGRLGGVLSRLPETEKLGKKFLVLQQQANALASNLDSAAKQNKELKRLSDTKEKLTSELKDLGTGEEVIAFLLAVANQTATAAKLGTKVRAWLAERNALELFKISL